MAANKVTAVRTRLGGDQQLRTFEAAGVKNPAAFFYSEA